MNLTEERKLKFDRRLQGRKDWVTDVEVQAELDSLPDVSDKIAAPEEDEPAQAATGNPAADVAEGTLPS